MENVNERLVVEISKQDVEIGILKEKLRIIKELDSLNIPLEIKREIILIIK